MGKNKLFLVILIATCYQLFAFEKLPNQHLISYGNENAPLQVTEYVSLSCPKCLELFRKDFKALQSKHVSTQNVRWIFHPHPADLLTLQAMVCLEQLSPKEKTILWEVLMNNLTRPSDGCFILQTAMETFGKPILKLDNLEFLEKTSAFSTAYKYLKQPDIVKELPTVEINGVIYEEFPNRKFLDKKISSLISQRIDP